MSVTLLFSRESSFYNMFWNFCIQVVLRYLPKASLCIALPLSRSTFHFVDKTMEGILSSFICSVCFNIHTFLLPLCTVDISDFPQSWFAKLQRLSPEEDEQQLLSVHLVSLSKVTLKFFLTGFCFKNNHAALLRLINHSTCQRWQLFEAAKCTCAQSWSAVVIVMTLLSPFN